MSGRRRRRPAVESLEGRMLLAGSLSPTSLVLISPDSIGAPTPGQLGAAYRQVVAIQAETLLALGDAGRRVQDALTQLAAHANHHVARDRRIVQVGADIASRAQQGLDIARGVEVQAANKYKIYIPNGLYPSGLGNLVKTAQTLGQELTYAGGRSTDAVVHKLNTLRKELTSGAVESSDQRSAVSGQQEGRPRENVWAS
jgi:hypothetical protein